MEPQAFIDRPLKSNDWNFELTVKDFVLTKPLARAEVDQSLTQSQKVFEKGYRSMSSKKNKNCVADLNQNPKKRARFSQDVFPTLTCGCCKLMHLQKRHLYCQLLSCACLDHVIVSIMQPANYLRHVFASLNVWPRWFGTCCGPRNASS